MQKRVLCCRLEGILKRELCKFVLNWLFPSLVHVVDQKIKKERHCYDMHYFKQRNEKDSYIICKVIPPDRPYLVFTMLLTIPPYCISHLRDSLITTNLYSLIHSPFSPSSPTLLPYSNCQFVLCI